MNLLKRSISSASSAYSVTNDFESIVNREEITIEDFKNSIKNWQIPKVQLNQIYQQSKFNLFSKTDYLIQTE